MTTSTQIVVVLLISSNLILLTEAVADSASSGSLWELSNRMGLLDTSPSTYVPPASSILECLRICQIKPDCDMFCFDASPNACFADTNIMLTSNQSAVPDLPCYFRVSSCSPTSGYSLVNGRCMKIHDRRPAKIDYSVAASTCSGEGGHLFDMLTTQDENALCLLLDHITDALPQYLRLGARKTGKSGFYWTEGSRLLYSSSFWDKLLNQPGGAEDDVAISTRTRKLHDTYYLQSAFVCQIDLN